MMMGALYGGSNASSSVAAAIPMTTAVAIVAVALRWRPAMSLAVLVVALFAVLHGWAHGLAAVRPAYVCGVLSATALLQLAGLQLGAFIERARSPAGT
jgi:urease accessory protein